MCTDAGAGDSRRVLGEPFRFYLCFRSQRAGNLHTRVNVLLDELNLQLILESCGVCVSRYMCMRVCESISRYACMHVYACEIYNFDSQL